MSNNEHKEIQEAANTLNLFVDRYFSAMAALLDKAQQQFSKSSVEYSKLTNSLSAKKKNTKIYGFRDCIWQRANMYIYN